MRELALTIALLLPAAAWAQTGVVATHPANKEGRLMTMEEAVMGVGTRPASVAAMWIDDDTYACMEGREIKAYKALSGEAAEFNGGGRAQGGPRRHAQGAAVGQGVAQ